MMGSAWGEVRPRSARFDAQKNGTAGGNRTSAGAKHGTRLSLNFIAGDLAGISYEACAAVARATRHAYAAVLSSKKATTPKNKLGG